MINPDLLKKILFYGNLVILVVLIYVFTYHNIEGITNMNCCGGVEVGVHYRETDIEPPDYISRCFRSSRSGGELSYEWSGFPCTSESSSMCCQNTNGDDLGECVATTGGGYCRGSTSNTMFRRGDDSPSPYLVRRDDTELDVNNARDMEDYFYDINASRKNPRTDDEMKDFLSNRAGRVRYISDKMYENEATRRERARFIGERNIKLKKIHQVKNTILSIHLIFTIMFAIIIKNDIVKDIDQFFTLLNQNYQTFLGRSSVVQS